MNLFTIEAPSVSCRRRIAGNAPLFFGEKRLAERFDEIVASFEIVSTVLLGRAEQTVFDHIKNDLTKILAAAHAPFLKHRHGHRPILAKSVLAQCFKQLLACHVIGISLDGGVDLPLCKGKTFGDKRHSLKEAEVKRDIDRALKSARSRR